MKNFHSVASGLLAWRRQPHVEENLCALRRRLEDNFSKPSVDLGKISFGVEQYVKYAAAIASADLFDSNRNAIDDLRRIDFYVRGYVKSLCMLKRYALSIGSDYYAQSFEWLFFGFMWSIWIDDRSMQKEILGFLSQAGDLDVLIEDDYSRSMAEPCLVGVFMHLIVMKSIEYGIDLPGISDASQVETGMTKGFEKESDDSLFKIVVAHLDERIAESEAFFAKSDCHGYLSDPCIIALPVEVFALSSAYKRQIDFAGIRQSYGAAFAFFEQAESIRNGAECEENSFDSFLGAQIDKLVA